MKSLEQVLCCEAYDPNQYGGAAQGKGFYLVIDNKQGFGAGGELDVTIKGNKIDIKEKKAPAQGNHDAFLCFEKAGSYNFEINADCDIKLRLGGMCKISNLTVKTTGKPLINVYLDIKKCEVFDISGVDTGRVDLDNLGGVKRLIGPTAKQCGFRIAKCSNLESIDLSGIQNTPKESGRLYIRNCKKLTSIDFPQAISMPLQLEKLPSLAPGVSAAADKLCKKCNVQYYDML